MPEKIRWGIMGGATIAVGAMIPAMASARNSTVVALASRTPDRLARAGDLAGEAKRYDDYGKLLEDDDVDAVYIALPNSMHREWTIRSLRAGKHVLCEKPLALDLAEGQEMVRVAGECDRLLMEAFMYRFNVQTKAFVEQLRGKARHLHVTFCSFHERDSSDIRLRERAGGGVLGDLGCYAVDVSRWLFGEPQVVHAHGTARAVDTSVACLLKFPDGSTSTIWTSFDVAPYQELLVSTEEGMHRLGPVDGNPVGHRPFSAWFDPLETNATEPYTQMVEAFADSMLLGRPIPLSLEGSLANLRVLDQIRQAACLPTPGLDR